MEGVDRREVWGENRNVVIIWNENISMAQKIIDRAGSWWNPRRFPDFKHLVLSNQWSKSFLSFFLPRMKTLSSLPSSLLLLTIFVYVEWIMMHHTHTHTLCCSSITACWHVGQWASVFSPLSVCWTDFQGLKSRSEDQRVFIPLPLWIQHRPFKVTHVV